MDRQVIQNYFLFINRFEESHTIDLVCDSPNLSMNYWMPQNITTSNSLIDLVNHKVNLW